MLKRNFHLFLLILLLTPQLAMAHSLKVKMYRTHPIPENPTGYIGYIDAKDTKYGVLLIPNIEGLLSGNHGFHMHTNPNCSDHGMAAGGHFDPKKTGKHLGPYNDNGHLGDLPVLNFIENKATTSVLAPRLRVAKLKGHAFVIHMGGDNYSDNPPMGGGGTREACGVIK